MDEEPLLVLSRAMANIPSGFVRSALSTTMATAVLSLPTSLSTAQERLTPRRQDGGDLDYKVAKEAFVSNNLGSSITRINLVCLTALTTYLLWNLLSPKALLLVSRYRKRTNPSKDWVYVFGFEFLLLVVPLLCVLTGLNSWPGTVNIVLSGAAVGVLVWEGLDVKDSRGVLPRANASPNHSRHASKDSDSGAQGEDGRDDRNGKGSYGLKLGFFGKEVKAGSGKGKADQATDRWIIKPLNGSIKGGESGDVESPSHAISFEHEENPSIPIERPDLLCDNSQALRPDLPISPSSVDSSHKRSAIPPSKSDHFKHVVSASSLRPIPSTPLSRSSSLSSPSVREKAQAEPKPPGVLKIQPQPFVTVWRAHMMLMTILAILAVDFRVFPREFGKTENWGTSIMDLGVGSFVFSLGVVSALPVLRSKCDPSLEGVRPPLIRSIVRALQRSAGVLALGVGRTIMVKGVDYPEHVTEYGVHWNFFFTLGFLPVVGVMCEKLWPRVNYSTMGFTTAFVHQALLSIVGLEDWVLSDRRVGLLGLNKEGVTSFLGYLSIFLLAIDTGLAVLPPDPYFVYRKKAPFPKKPKLGKLANVLSSWAIIWWTLLGIVCLFAGFGLDDLGTGVAGGKFSVVSRRLANLPYILWVAAFNVSFLFCYLVIHMWTVQRWESFSRRSAADATPNIKLDAPIIFEAINKNGLVVFLVANIFTGLVNISIQSMFTSDSVAIMIMLLYSMTLVGVAWAMRKRRWRI